jgi:hypothetical protein
MRATLYKGLGSVDITTGTIEASFGETSLKHLLPCLVVLGFLGLGMVGCTEHNPAFHEPADGGAGPSQDVAVSDTSASDDHPHPDTPGGGPKDAEPRPDKANGPKDSGGQGDVVSELPDASGQDGRADTGGSPDSNPSREAGTDTWVPDASSADRERLDRRGPGQDTVDVFLEMDAPEGDTGKVLPDAQEPDAWPDAESSELDAQV